MQAISYDGFDRAGSSAAGFWFCLLVLAPNGCASGQYDKIIVPALTALRQDSGCILLFCLQNRCPYGQCYGLLLPARAGVRQGSGLIWSLGLRIVADAGNFFGWPGPRRQLRGRALVVFERSDVVPLLIGAML